MGLIGAVLSKRVGSKPAMNVVMKFRSC